MVAYYSRYPFLLAEGSVPQIVWFVYDNIWCGRAIAKKQVYVIVRTLLLHDATAQKHREIALLVEW